MLHIAYHKILFPEPATNFQRTQNSGYVMKRKWGKCIRLPCIHKREPAVFHFIKVSLWMNHDAVPSRWSLRAALWFVDGSGGQSQFRTFS